MSKESKIFDVVNAWVEELSLAPMGQNGKKYLLVKAMEQKDMKALLSAEDEELTEALEKAGLGDEALEAGEVIGRLLKAYGDTLPEGFLKILGKATGLEVDQATVDAELKRKKEFEEDEAKRLATAAAAAAAAATGIDAALSKASPEVKEIFLFLQKAIKTSNERAEAAETKATTLEKAARDKYFDDVMSGLKAIPGDHVALRKALASMDPIHGAIITNALKGAASLVESGALTEKGGTMSKAGEGSASARIMAMAKARMKKAPGTTIESAMCAVMDENPELYDQYLAEGGEM